MNIVHIHKSYHTRDGASRYMYELMALTASAGHDVAPFALQDSSNEVTPWSPYFTPHLASDPLRQTARAFWNTAAYADVKEMLLVYKPDIAHIHNIYTHLSPSVLFALKELQIPTVMTVHDYALVSGNYALWDAKRREAIAPDASFIRTARTAFVQRSVLRTAALDAIFRLHRHLRWYHRLIDTFLCYSHYTRHVLIEAGFPEDKIHVVGAFASPFLTKPVEPSQLPLGGKESSLDRRSHQIDVLLVGRYESYKGIAFALEIAERMPEVTFAFAGSGSCAGYIDMTEKRCKNVRNLGFLSAADLWRTVQGAKCVFVPSLWPEPYGLVALEALALGTPVVVSDRGGLPEIVEDGVSGLVYQATSLASAEKCLRKVVQDASYRAHLAQAAGARAYAIGNPQNHLKTVLEHYHGLLSSGCF